MYFQDTHNHKQSCNYMPSILVGVALWMLLSPLALYGTPAEDLAQRIETERRTESLLMQEREAAFQAALEEQELATQKALADRDAAEQLSVRLSSSFDDNEILIAELYQFLEQQQGNLGELFGVTRQVAGDAASQLNNSMFNSQVAASLGAADENRVDFLRRLATAKALPSIHELERLWIEILREMEADGEVSRYPADIFLQDSTVTKFPVVRVGTFTAVADGRYLSYLPGQSSLSMLPRQPDDATMLSVAGDLIESSAASRPESNNESKYVPAIVDPTRGGLMSLYVSRPNIMERIEKGEVVGYIIIGVGLLGVLFALFQYAYLIGTKIKIRNQLRHGRQPLDNNPLGRMLKAVSAHSGRGRDSPELAELRLSEAMLREVPRLERFQAFLKLAVAAGPLLGLIGTVIGMIITFESITASGSSDPKLMAQGIGQAMIATVLGLGIAIPLLFLHTGLAALSRSVIHTLEDHSSEILESRLSQVAG